MVLHVASHGGPHVALVAILVVAGAAAGFFAVTGSSAGPAVMGLSRDNALALGAGLVAGLAFLLLLVI